MHIIRIVMMNNSGFSKFTALFVSLLTICVFLTGVSDLKAEENPQDLLTYQVLANKTAVEPGESFRLVLRQDIIPHWHTYWKNPGDSGNPSTVSWEAPEGAEFGEMKFPTPKRIDAGPLVTFGYEDTVLYTLDVKAPKEKAGKSFEFTAKFESLVCKEICLPAFDEVEISIPYGQGQSTNQNIFERAKAAKPKMASWEAVYTGDDNSLALTLRPGEELTESIVYADELAFFPEEWGILQYKPKPVVMQTAKDKALLRFERDTRPLSEIETLNGIIKIIDGDNYKAFRIAAVKDGDQNIKASATPASIKGVKTGTTAQPHTGPAGRDITALWAIVLAVIGGVILNLMPCVFPVLSMKALSLSRLGDKERRQAQLHGLSYTAGILAMFAAIAAVFLAFRAGGSEIGWGFQFQNPYIVLGLAYLLFLIGLNLSGFFDIAGRFTGIGQNMTTGGGHKGSFMTGMLATIVATPCTAPFMGTAIGFAITQPPVIGMSIFLSLGLGLALPYLALCFIPALRSSMPKPGPWMDVFKQFLAFPMYASAVWLVWVFSIQTGPEGVLIALSGMTGLAFAIWLVRTAPSKAGAGRYSVLGLAAFIVLSVIVSGAGLKTLDTAGMNVSSSTKNAKAGEAIGGIRRHAYSPAGLESLLETDDPVFVNMTAAWCITCKVNERVALSRKSVEQVFKDQNVHYMKGDWTNYNAEITAYLESYGRSGVPLYIFYGRPDEKTGKRPEPVVLPQVLTPSIVKNTVLNKTK